MRIKFVQLADSFTAHLENSIYIFEIEQNAGLNVSPEPGSSFRDTNLVWYY